jgi:hypothetical protein
MRRPRLRSTLSALALLLLAAGLAVGVPRAEAIDPFPLDGAMTMSNEHFTLHFNGNDRDTPCPSFITQERAGDILGMLDRARKFYADMNVGFPYPIPDSDAHVHVSIDDFSTGCISYGGVPFGIPGPLDRWDAFTEPIAVSGASNIHLDVDTATTYPIVAHEVFHLVEDAMVTGVDQWLQEATAEWAATRANRAAGGVEMNPDRSMDCVGSSCGDTEYDKNGYPGWMLIEYLTQRFGTQTTPNDAKVRELWQQAQDHPTYSATTDLAAVIEGGPLARFYNDYFNTRLTGGFTFAPLKGALPETIGGFVVGATDGTSDDLNVSVNHLAARYLFLKHATADGPCFAATLTVNVKIPLNVESYPAYYAGTAGASAQPLTISGSNASIAVPWNTCAGSPDAYVSLPNDTLDLDGREFVVNLSLKMDFTRPATATAPPPGAHVIGSVVSAPTSDPAPTLKIYAPEVLRVSSKTRLLRFVVFSSGEGKLAAAVGSTGLGSAQLRSGNNDVRFVLPTQLFKSLRTKRASNVLSLTSQSPSGTKGATFTRRVVVQVPPKPKKKATKKH